jgi:hypothetical protein
VAVVYLHPVHLEVFVRAGFRIVHSQQPDGAVLIADLAHARPMPYPFESTRVSG